MAELKFEIGEGQIQNAIKETILSKVVGDMIRTIAVDEVKKIISSQESEIRRIIRTTLGESFTDSILAQLESSLAHKVISNITINASVE